MLRDACLCATTALLRPCCEAGRSAAMVCLCAIQQRLCVLAEWVVAHLQTHPRRLMMSGRGCPSLLQAPSCPQAA